MLGGMRAASSVRVCPGWPALHCYRFVFAQVGRPFTVLFAHGATHCYAHKYFKTKFEALVGESWLPVSTLPTKSLVAGLRVRDESPLDFGGPDMDLSATQAQRQLTSAADGVCVPKSPSGFLISSSGLAQRHAARLASKRNAARASQYGYMPTPLSESGVLGLMPDDSYLTEESGGHEGLATPGSPSKLQDVEIEVFHPRPIHVHLSLADDVCNFDSA